MGTFAIMSLMTSQALGKIDFDQINQTNLTSDIENEILYEKVGVVTTLAFFVGLIQVQLHFYFKSNNEFLLFLVDFRNISSWFCNNVSK